MYSQPYSVPATDRPVYGHQEWCEGDKRPVCQNNRLNQALTVSQQEWHEWKAHRQDQVYIKLIPPTGHNNIWLRNCALSLLIRVDQLSIVCKWYRCIGTVCMKWTHIFGQVDFQKAVYQGSKNYWYMIRVIFNSSNSCENCKLLCTSQNLTGALAASLIYFLEQYPGIGDFCVLKLEISNNLSCSIRHAL
mgnify:CR=1 FL=1